MKGLKKYVLMLSLTGASLFVSTPCAEAQWYVEAAMEAALLAQQIAQFLGDLSYDIEKWSDVERRLKELWNISKTISNGVQAFSSVNNVIKASEQITRTAKSIESYQKYLLTFGDSFKIERSYYIYKRFLRQTTNIFDEVQRTIKSFDRLRDAKPLQYLRAVDNCTSELAVVVMDLGEDSKSETVELCFSAAMDEVAAQNQTFYQLNII